MTHMGHMGGGYKPPMTPKDWWVLSMYALGGLSILGGLLYWLLG